MSSIPNYDLYAAAAAQGIDPALAHLDPRRLIVFSRDELKQYEVRQQFGDDPRLRWFIGDVRDERRLLRAMHGVDHVVHAGSAARAQARLAATPNLRELRMQSVPWAPLFMDELCPRSSPSNARSARSATSSSSGCLRP